MNERVKELIAWRDEYVKLSEELKTHPGKELYSDFDMHLSQLPDDKQNLVKAYLDMLALRRERRAQIEGNVLFMVDHIEVLESLREEANEIIAEQRSTIAEYQTQVSWYRG